MDFIFDPSLVLYLPLYQLDGASFMSKDAYGRLCTVTGALWRPDGHYFDGSDDNIVVSKNVLGGLNAVTIEILIKNLSFTSYDYLAGNVSGGGANDSAGLFGYSSAVYFDTRTVDGRVLTSTATDYTDYHHWVGTYDGAQIILYKDGVPGSPLAQTGALKAGGNFTVAAKYTTLLNNAKCQIALIRVYNRALTPQEIQHNYLATKWRYR